MRSVAVLDGARCAENQGSNLRGQTSGDERERGTSGKRTQRGAPAAICALCQPRKVRAWAGVHALMAKGGARSANGLGGGLQEGTCPFASRCGAVRAPAGAGCVDDLDSNLPSAEPVGAPGKVASCGGLDRCERWLVHISWNDGATHDAQS